jgi:hypothetical protein
LAANAFAAPLSAADARDYLGIVLAGIAWVYPIRAVRHERPFDRDPLSSEDGDPRAGTASEVRVGDVTEDRGAVVGVALGMAVPKRAGHDPRAVNGSPSRSRSTVG